MTLEQWSFIGQIAAAIFTFVGVIAALFVATKTLKEMQLDRRLSREPYLAFEPGGKRYPIEFKELDDESKRNYALPKSGTLVGLKTSEGKVTVMYGCLRNYGPGPAMATAIVWIAKEVWLGTEKFRIDADKSTEAKYCRELNTIPASPNHILPNQTAEFFRLPTFIQRDVEKKITKVSGIIEIDYLDLFKEPHTTKQSFYIFTKYDGDSPYIHFTFSDIVD